jgi:hypothetical protein
VLRGLIKSAIAVSPAGRWGFDPASYLAVVPKLPPGARGIVQLPVRVATTDCVGYTGFPYRSDGWHYLVELLREIDADPELPWQRSILARFHDRFRPNSAYHLVEPFDPGVQFRPPLGIMPWGDVAQRADGAPPKPKSWAASRWYGPSDPAVVEDEYQRLRRAYRSIQRRGYDPWRKGFIGGQFLRATDGSYRYVVLQGNHRAAILAHLGCRSFLARAIPGRVPIVDERAISEWEHVKTGACGLEDARAYLQAYFRTRGVEQGRLHGLVE